ncbi:hypothetical protein H310_09948 [Aphanomyces invadans]|uniref:Uncharacterized protein n=1 Tax=Aphanomyces invadans TaxID=157072 RepID=A0A024TU37_9STRA|nr:hypothetical protein H310_09948 [Aphanomyces invadans]ETV97146.1 hypothetical protein H310_09948 [Aphanomyces invadans]|eukprot:XP_008874392.1 hypothetical protein H310_09948 [Aphanomyces invadans]
MGHAKKAAPVTVLQSPDVTYSISSHHRSNTTQRPKIEHKHRKQPCDSVAPTTHQSLRRSHLSKETDPASNWPKEASRPSAASSQDSPHSTTYVEKQPSTRPGSSLERSNRKSNAWVVDKQDVAKPRVRVDPKPRLDRSPSPPKGRIADESPTKPSPWWSKSNPPSPQSCQVSKIGKRLQKARSLIVDSENVVEDIERWSGAKWDKEKGFVKAPPPQQLQSQVSPRRRGGPEFVCQEHTSASRRAKQHGARLVGTRHQRATNCKIHESMPPPHTPWV